MDTIDHIVLLGLSQRTASVALRERYAVEPRDAESLLRQLAADERVDEAALVSTCNRTEVLVVGGEISALTTYAKSAFFRNLADEHLYSYRGIQAVMHLFRVASGLDSLVLGESEILGQVKRAFDMAQACGTCGNVLQPLLTQALRVGKRVRTETTLGEGSLSVARVGVEVAARALGRFEGRCALVVGAGETGILAAKHLRSRGLTDLHFANRSTERGADAARELDAESHSLEELPKLIEAADLVITCVDGAPGLLDASRFNPRRLALRDQPLVVIDLSVPRAVTEDVSRFDGVLVYDLDDLAPIIDENREGRDAAIETTAPILVGEMHKFLSLRTYAAFSPAIAELRERFGETREAVLDAVTGGKAAARELELIHELERRLLDLALGQLKESARYVRSEEALDQAYRRFLDETSR